MGIGQWQIVDKYKGNHTATNSYHKPGPVTTYTVVDCRLQKTGATSLYLFYQIKSYVNGVMPLCTIVGWWCQFVAAMTFLRDAWCTSHLVHLKPYSRWHRILLTCLIQYQGCLVIVH